MDSLTSRCKNMGNKLNSVDTLKSKLANVFDDDFETNQWRNYADFLILSVIVLSTIEIFFSTFDSIESQYTDLLRYIDLFTTAFFTVEVALRIWTADLIDRRFSGFWGRIRYCFTFFGFIDIISTFPFYVNLFVPIGYTTFKMFRVLRLLRFFRYMKSFALLKRAALSKSREMMVSLQFLLVVTILLAFSLFFVEHEAQPVKFKNGLDAFLWAFGQFAGDSGQYVVNNPPVTNAGRLITYLLGILNIAIVAVPAGLLGSAFVDVMEEKKRLERLEENKLKLKYAFKRELDRFTNYRVVPLHASVEDIQIKLQLSIEEILDIVHNSNNFRFCNMAKTIPRELRPQDKLVVENFFTNTDYGCRINRNSNVTIVSTSSYDQPAMGNFAYYLAMMGGFNYLSKEAESNPLHHVSYYNINKQYFEDSGEKIVNPVSVLERVWTAIVGKRSVESEIEKKLDVKNEKEKEVKCLQQFLNDVAELSSGKWVIFLLSTNERYDTAVHFSTGVAKGAGLQQKPLADASVFSELYSALSVDLQKGYGLLCDCDRYFDTSNASNIGRIIGAPERMNAFSIFFSYDVTCRNSAYLAIAQTMARVIKQHLDSDGQINTGEMEEYGYGFPLIQTE